MTNWDDWDRSLLLHILRGKPTFPTRKKCCSSHRHHINDVAACLSELKEKEPDPELSSFSLFTIHSHYKEQASEVKLDL